MEDKEEEKLFPQLPKEMADLGLPKWPQIMIVGDSVTEEQALDIILRTDKFITGISEPMSRRFTQLRALIHKQSGMDAIVKAANKHDHEGVVFFLKYHAQKYIRDALGFCSFECIHNTWAASSYLHGAYGFCSPEGKIFYCDNSRGSYPSTQSYYEDLLALAEAFPYLRFKSSMYGGEHCDDAVKCVISFVVENGTVTPTLEDFGLRAHSTRGANEGADAIIDIMRGQRTVKETALSPEFLKRCAERIQPLVEPALKHALSILEEDE
ncbi:hypothetical protein LU11_gp320 [Pseudomonas phage Lu11]|uniref:hypothetical protein n=1 Tax=Pseudomonas phage Lu11 TaxID=1161927 RepID=UPI00025F186A|nr:hypothetical protein LU11_gp320 [Pseudomonas phage Lu11]AFH14851.1 hypothetical protein Lu11_0313 [Pseudomonas phage Lu11]